MCEASRQAMVRPDFGGPPGTRRLMSRDRGTRIRFRGAEDGILTERGRADRARFNSTLGLNVFPGIDGFAVLQHLQVHMRAG